MLRAKTVMKSALRKYVPEGLQRASLDFTVHQLRDSLTERYVERYGNIVQAGPFAGMELPPTFFWGDGDRLPKLLGSYEAELHPALMQVAGRDYAIAVDIGCAEGYYAIGLARLIGSQVPVAAFDISEAAQSICAQAAEKNRVGDRLKIAGLCSTETLDKLLGHGNRSLLILDCEGAELDILNPDIVPGLHESDLIIECHDWVHTDLTAELYRRFSATHLIEQITEGPREAHDFPFLESLNGFERALAVCEFRPRLMHWLFCSAKV